MVRNQLHRVLLVLKEVSDVVAGLSGDGENLTSEETDIMLSLEELRSELEEELQG
jgi:hypothetical protein